MILSSTVTKEGFSTQFPLYEPGSLDVRYDVHVRIEPKDDTVTMLLIYDRIGRFFWLDPTSMQARWRTESLNPLQQGANLEYLVSRQRVAAEVWKRFHKFVPREVLA